MDDDDYEWLSQWKWQARPRGTTVYAQRGFGGTTIQMHRQLMDFPPEVDHRNGNGLDNQRHNLRVSTHTENMRNQKRPSSNTSGYKGVSFDKGSGKWKAYIRIDVRQQKTLGRYPNAEEAARAYNAAAIAHYGEFAALNEIMPAAVAQSAKAGNV